MIDAAWAPALGENAVGVWISMIYVASGGTIEALESGLDLMEHFHLCDTPKIGS